MPLLLLLLLFLLPWLTAVLQAKSITALEFLSRVKEAAGDQEWQAAVSTHSPYESPGSAHTVTKILQWSTASQKKKQSSQVPLQVRVLMYFLVSLSFLT